MAMKWAHRMAGPIQLACVCACVWIRGESKWPKSISHAHPFNFFFFSSHVWWSHTLTRVNTSAIYFFLLLILRAQRADILSSLPPFLKTCLWILVFSLLRLLCLAVLAGCGRGSCKIASLPSPPLIGYNEREFSRENCLGESSGWWWWWSIPPALFWWGSPLDSMAHFLALVSLFLLDFLRV